MFNLSTKHKWYGKDISYSIKNPVLIKTFYATKYHTCYIYKDNDIIFCTNSKIENSSVYLDYLPSDINFVFLVDHQNKIYMYENQHGYTVSKEYMYKPIRSYKTVLAGSRYLWIYFLRLLPKNMSRMLQSGVRIADYKDGLTIEQYKIKYYGVDNYNKLHHKLKSMPLQWKSTVHSLINIDLYNCKLYDHLKSVNILRLSKLNFIDSRLFKIVEDSEDPNKTIEELYKKSMKLCKTRKPANLISNAANLKNTLKGIFIHTASWNIYRKHYENYVDDIIYNSIIKE
jgi:hypothetical protein